jgi:transketolase
MSDIAKILPRDAFIDEIFLAAKKNPNIYFITADLGAKALDRFRVELPKQIIHGGICEQNMMDLAAGLAQNGKIVYTYAMAPFVTLRCYEQIKVAVASMFLPVTIIGNGVGYSYNDAGPTHYATEDISCMRALGGMEILTPGDTVSTLAAARYSYTQPALRYIRLDRSFLPPVYGEGDERFWKDGLVEIEPGERVCILTNGYMLQTAREAKALLASDGLKVGLIDVFRLRPIDGAVLARLLARYERVVTLEEHFLSGGLGGAIVEAMADAGILKPVKRIGVQDAYLFENGGRQHILRKAGLDVPTVAETIRGFCKQHA